MLYEFARLELGNTHLAHAIDDYLRDRILRKGIIATNEQKSKYEDWEAEINSFELQEFLELKKPWLMGVCSETSRFVRSLKNISSTCLPWAAWCRRPTS
jgi:hypothetical protein